MKNWISGLVAAALLFAVPALADDISNGSWSTTDAGNNSSPPNGWPAGMFPNQVEPAARADKGGIKRWWERANPTLSTTGSAGHYILTPSNPSYPSSYSQGEVFCAKANFTSVGNDDLNINSLGAKPIYSALNSISKIVAGEILINQMACVAYDGALNSSAGGFQLLSFPNAAALNGVLNQLGNAGVGSLADGSSADIFDTSSSNAVFAIVKGGISNNVFVDVIVCINFNGPCTVLSSTSLGSPPVRTWTMSGASVNLALSGGTAGTYALDAIRMFP